MRDLGLNPYRLGGGRLKELTGVYEPCVYAGIVEEWCIRQEFLYLSSLAWMSSTLSWIHSSLKTRNKTGSNQLIFIIRVRLCRWSRYTWYSLVCFVLSGSSPVWTTCPHQWHDGTHSCLCLMTMTRSQIIWQRVFFSVLPWWICFLGNLSFSISQSGMIVLRVLISRMRDPRGQC